MSDVKTFKALSLCMTACVGMLAVAACAIRLRDDENQARSAAPAAQESNTTAAEFERCRTITYEQKDVLPGCQKLWTEKRRQFFGRTTGSSDSSGPLNPKSSSPTSPKDDSLPPFRSFTVPRQGE